jgi:hypothetical protein
VKKRFIVALILRGGIEEASIAENPKIRYPRGDTLLPRARG